LTDKNVCDIKKSLDPTIKPKKQKKEKVMAETEKKKRKINCAALIPGISVAQFVIQQLLAGLEIKVIIDGRPYKGYVHQLDFARGSDHVFASVVIDDDKEETIYINVAIHDNGVVNIIPNQPKD
jgi:hypothetical protein